MKWLNKIPKLNIIRREEKIMQYCSDKDVLHLGFVDSGIIESRLSNNEWLHEKISRISSHVTGIDIDNEGIEFAKKLGYQDVFSWDVQTPVILPMKYDVIIAGEIIEHLSNIQGFLEFSKLNLKENGILIITTPNCMRYYNFIYSLFNFESIHPDHTLQFSYTTICQLLDKNSLFVKEAYFYYTKNKFLPEKNTSILISVLKYIENFFDTIARYSILRISPNMSDGLFIIASKKK